MKNLRKRPTYDEIINYIEVKQPKIKYPDRKATFLRNSHYLSKFDGDLFDVEEQQQKFLAEQIRQALIMSMGPASLAGGPSPPPGSTFLSSAPPLPPPSGAPPPPSGSASLPSSGLFSSTGRLFSSIGERFRRGQGSGTASLMQSQASQEQNRETTLQALRGPPLQTIRSTPAAPPSRGDTSPASSDMPSLEEVTPRAALFNIRDKDATTEEEEYQKTDEVMENMKKEEEERKKKIGGQVRSDLAFIEKYEPSTSSAAAAATATELAQQAEEEEEEARETDEVIEPEAEKAEEPEPKHKEGKRGKAQKIYVDNNDFYFWSDARISRETLMFQIYLRGLETQLENKIEKLKKLPESGATDKPTKKQEIQAFVKTLIVDKRWVIKPDKENLDKRTKEFNEWYKDFEEVITQDKPVLSTKRKVGKPKKVK